MDSDQLSRRRPFDAATRRSIVQFATPNAIAFLMLALSASVGLVLRLWLAVHDDGIYWPDEIYQSVEPAHRLVFGYGLVPWEFVVGARSWTFPGFVALILKLCALAGLTEPRSYLTVVRFTFSAIGVITAGGVYYLARSLGASAIAAAIGASLFLLVAPSIYFAPRAMNESAAAPPIVFGLSYVLRSRARAWHIVFGASLLSLGVFLRLQTAIFVVGVIAVLLIRRDRAASLPAIAVFAAAGLLFGLLDLLTWGSWFHSAAAYLRFNVFEGRAAQWGTSPPLYYWNVLLSSMGVAGLFLLALALVSVQRAPALFGLALAFLLAHSLIPHKELRFLLPVMPVLAALAAIGLETMSHLTPAWAFRTLTGLVLLSAAVSAVTFHQLTFGELGAYTTSRPNASAYDDSGSVNRLLLEAHRRSDLCGLKVEGMLPAWAGGYSYLHRHVNLYPESGPPNDSGKFDYVITRLGTKPQGMVVAMDGDRALVRLPNSGCVPDASYSERL